PAQRGGEDLPISAPKPYAAPAQLSRRRFLEAAGFTLSAAALSGCGRSREKTALPFPEQPEGAVPGRMRQYACTCAGCPAACGLLVGVRDGRPLKMEGMPEHPLSRGGLCAVGQALPLGLYDRERLKRPLRAGEESDWTQIDKELLEKLDTLKQNGGAVRFVTSTVNSPTLQDWIDRFLKPFPDARHVMFDAVSSSAILDAHQKTQGVRVLPHYRFDTADVVVSFGADFLGTWISPVEFTRAWRSKRVPSERHREMSQHMQFEGRMSLTGSNADVRLRLRPEDYGVVLSDLAAELMKREPGSGSPAFPESRASERASARPIPIAILNTLADKLWNARGRSLVVSDSQDVAVQVLVNFVNYVLGNYGKTLDVARPSRQRLGDDGELSRLLEEFRAGKVAALFVAGTDFTHNLPRRDDLARLLKTIPLVVSFAGRENDFTEFADFVCPDHHPLEAWWDAEPIAGLVTLSQPALPPLGETRSILESLAKWSGKSGGAYDLLRAFWRDKFPKDFVKFWDKSLHDGHFEAKPERVNAKPFRRDAIKLVIDAPEKSGRTLVLYSKVGMPDSRHAHNPWLHELPDPVTKVTWDNYACISPRTAEETGVKDGDVLRVETPPGAAVELPAFVQPGQHDGVVAVALGYGVKGTGRFENVGPQWFEAKPTTGQNGLVGVNAAPLLEFRSGILQYTIGGVKLAKTGRHHALASTQEHHFIEVPDNVAPPGAERRDVVQETTLSAFRKNAHAGKPESHELDDPGLWADDHPKEGHQWGMAIDLNACTGCSGCIIACQSENNVPVVGRDEVRRQREMHWIRIDRYYSGGGDDVEVAHQPMMCQHCNHAPCETVCPVLATIHGEEGLNHQAYNRCVGTRYCANNCPYKVRRFNWFDYPHDDLLQNLALNPDVTVRMRGVMEKCSMCVQRIHDGKAEAKRKGEPLDDGAIQTACQQSCPAQAILFGDMNDPKSALSQALKDPRRYHVLEELNVRPAVSYLRLVRNREEDRRG
ncbi:MAG: 4Fe-4S dicluster domain-containing protein, partial [Planctomycetaceae bacterium]